MTLLIIWSIFGYLAWRLVVYVEVNINKSDVVVADAIILIPILIGLGPIGLLMVLVSSWNDLFPTITNIPFMQKVIHKAKKDDN